MPWLLHISRSLGKPHRFGVRHVGRASTAEPTRTVAIGTGDHVNVGRTAAAGQNLAAIARSGALKWRGGFGVTISTTNTETP